MSDDKGGTPGRPSAEASAARYLQVTVLNMSRVEIAELRRPGKLTLAPVNDVTAAIGQ